MVALRRRQTLAGVIGRSLVAFRFANCSFCSRSEQRQCGVACVIAAVLLAILACRGGAADEPRPDLVIADFEGDDYGSWKVTGEAFGKGPARGTLPNQMPVDGFLGKGLVNSFAGGDRTTGTLTSAPIKIERRFLQFLIGGGRHPGQTCINLLVDGKVVRTATGPNGQPGGTEHLDWHAWEVADLAGREAVLQIVDEATGGWGHINIDHIVQTDRKLPGVLMDARRELTLDRRYLNLPVKNGAPQRRVRLEVDGRVVREFEIELAPAEPDFWAFVDVGAFQGKPASIVVDRLPEDSRGLKQIEAADEIRGAENLYREPLRPQFHFSSRRGWNNDPNGLVFFAGEYHLYYQHNPYGWNWGNMHWGHAQSVDLVHWKEQPIALYPRQFGDWAFSGSAVVDTRNTSGWSEGIEPPLVAAYTSTGRGECIVYSVDRGRTWREYDGNPVVKHQGRDPRLLWHQPTKRWVMAVYDEADGKRQIAFHTSPDLKKWELASRIDGFFECPDLYELPVDGDENRKRWVLSAADSHYLIGTFDGREFRKESGKHPGNYGAGFYAAQTFSDEPDGKRIIIGWLQAAAPGMPFNQCMSFPCELSLRTTADGVRLHYQPVKQLSLLHDVSTSIPAQDLRVGDNPLGQVTGELLDVQLDLRPGEASELELSVRGVPIRYDVRKGELACRDRRAPAPLVDGRLKLQVLVDRTSIEIFAADGLVYMPLAAGPAAGDQSLGLIARGGTARVESGLVHTLKSAWGKADR